MGTIPRYARASNAIVAKSTAKMAIVAWLAGEAERKFKFSGKFWAAQRVGGLLLWPKVNGFGGRLQ